MSDEGMARTRRTRPSDPEGTLYGTDVDLAMASGGAAGDARNDDAGYLGADDSERVVRTIPQRAAASMSRAQWESATSSMRALSVGGQELLDSDEADVEAALASLDMPPGESPAMYLPQEAATRYLPREQAMPEPRTTMLDPQTRPARQEARTTMLGREGAPQQARGAGSTMVAPPTLRRDAPVARPAAPSRPYDDGAYVNSRRDAFLDERHEYPGAAAATGAGLLGFVAILLRLAAIAVIGLIIVTAIPMGLGSFRIHIVNLMARIDDFLPSAIAGKLVFQTVFGGTFRGDLALLSLGLFIIDWLLSRGAMRLRGGR